MFHFIEAFYLIEILIVIFIIILGYLFWDKRYKKRKSNTVPNGFVRTEEVNIDPITNKTQRIYYNTSNGERIYIDED